MICLIKIEIKALKHIQIIDIQNIYNDMRNLTFSLNYNFGNNKVKTNSKKIENTEKQRLKL